jgi:hypothetical protein
MKKIREFAMKSLVAFLTLPALLPLKAAATGSENLNESLTQVGEGAYGEDVSNQPELPEMVGSIINVALGLLGMVLLVLIIYGGFLWMTAGGNSDQVDKAKKILINSIIGLVIIMAAYAISTFVFGAILGATTGA